MQLDYSQAAYAIRPDFAAGHTRYWQRLAQPGSWLTGHQRVEIAKEVRNALQCELCKQRKAALSPNSVKGSHDRVSDLPEVIVDVIHRVVTDPNRLTKTWFEGVIDQGVTAEEYVEVIGTIVHVHCIDEFCRAIGVAPHELPQPREGEPHRSRPNNLEDAGAWVPLMSQSVDEDGPEGDLAGELVANVIRALSLVPDEVRTLLDLIAIHYLESKDIVNLTQAYEGNLSRVQMEVVAARVSSYNDCFY